MDISLIVIYTNMLFLLAMFFVILHRKFVIITVLVVFVGVFCNIIVVKMNHGEMPVFIKNMSLYTKNDLQTDPRHQEGTKNTKLAFLADHITTSETQNIYSPGDISMMIGPLVLVVTVLSQVIYTLLVKGFTEFLCNNLSVSYCTIANALYAIYLGCKYILLHV